MLELRNLFMEKWGKYFPGVDLPLVFFYTDDDYPELRPEKSEEWRCVICDLGRVRKGRTICLNTETINCGGGRRYFGFTRERSSDFDYFLSCGRPGGIEGERYKKTPQLVRKLDHFQPPFRAPGKNIIFKRWDKIEDEDRPEAAIFFARADVLSGLFNLVNFDEETPHGVIAPFCSGCSSIVYHPFMEARTDHPRSILGMFDTSARPCVPADILTLAVPWPKFLWIVEDMDDSHLVTKTWAKVKERIERG